MTDVKDLQIREAQWPEDRETLRAIRARVFIEEQGVPESIEWDGLDAQARHVLAERAGETLGCGRLLSDGRIGRLAVSAGLRGRGIGERLLQALLELAQHGGASSVYLHAQADAVGFYERAGFVARGEPFDEAGIRHLDMYRELDYRDWAQALTGLTYPEPFAQLAVAQARLARRELRILSPKLDPRVFEQEDLLSGMRALLRRGRRSRVQILVQDARALTQRGHRLLNLARRLPSGIEIRRLAEHPDWNGDTQILRDRDSMLALPGDQRAPAFYRPGDRARCTTAINRFEDLWRVGAVDPEFRALSL